MFNEIKSRLSPRRCRRLAVDWLRLWPAVFPYERMLVKAKRTRRFVSSAYRLVLPFFDPMRFTRAVRNLPFFVRDLRAYRRNERVSIFDLYPCLHDRTPATPTDSHYFYQHAWGLRRIVAARPLVHIDAGSSWEFVASLSAVTKVVFLDIRPLYVHLPGLFPIAGDLLALPFRDESVRSLSCLHVLEHVGLGRYGDNLDHKGTSKAAVELTRVLAPDGDLYVSLPVGRSRVCFNAHRIHSPEQVLEMFRPLRLIEFSGVDDEGYFRDDTSSARFSQLKYGCGMFWFRK